MQELTNTCLVNKLSWRIIMNAAIANTLKTAGIALASALVFGLALRTGFQSEKVGAPAR
jgi:hypothetical protein